MKITDINGKELALADISKLVIYGSGKKLFEIENSGFESYSIKTNRYGHESIDKQYNGGPVEMVLKNPVKRANKENLSRKDNYTLNYTPDWIKWETRKALYIHESEISVSDIGDITAMETEEERNYLHAFVLTFNNPVIFQRLHIEKIPCGDNWRIPDNGKWGSGYGPENAPQYDTYDNSKSLFATKRGFDPNEKGVIKRWFTFERIENGAEIVTAQRYYTKTEYSKERERKNKIAAALNDSGLFNNSFSHYDIDKLEKVLKIELL